MIAGTLATSAVRSQKLLCFFAARRKLASLLVAVALGAPRLAFAEVPLVGLFEGHGIAPPRDPELARRAQVAAQRLSLRCQSFDEQSGLPVTTVCSDSERALAELGPDAAAAILDVLDEPRICTEEKENDPLYPAMLRALANTGRMELVPILLRASNRLAARADLADRRIERFARHYAYVDGLEDALVVLTYVTPKDAQVLDPAWSKEHRFGVPYFVHWYEAHQNESRAVWRNQAIARAQKLQRDSDRDTASWARCRLVEFTETRADAIARLKAHVNSRACSNWACAKERFVLDKLEPLGKWRQSL